MVRSEWVPDREKVSRDLGRGGKHQSRGSGDFSMSKLVSWGLRGKVLFFWGPQRGLEDKKTQVLGFQRSRGGGGEKGKKDTSIWKA